MRRSTGAAPIYIPDHFSQPDPQAVDRLIAAAPLACVVGQGPQGLLANHLPLLRGPDGALIGHVALANDMHRLLAPDTPVVAIFRGEQGYVSPNWYPSKADHHRHVPTWNYEVVHLHGRIRFSHDAAQKRRAVAALTAIHERKVNGDAGWRMGDAPPDYLEAMLGAIVALRIEVERVEAKAKLSQNRAARDRAGAIAGAQASGQAAGQQAAGQAALAARMAADLAADLAAERDKP